MSNADFCIPALIPNSFCRLWTVTLKMNIQEEVKKMLLQKGRMHILKNKKDNKPALLGEKNSDKGISKIKKNSSNH